MLNEDEHNLVFKVQQNHYNFMVSRQESKNLTSEAVDDVHFMTKCPVFNLEFVFIPRNGAKH